MQVDFPFATQYSKIWMRVMVPNAGSSDAVDKNSGIVFIPEKGDQVMVGFEFGDPNRSYVMGSMFHGKNGETNNAIKSIILRCGTQVSFNDDQGSVHIEIPSGSTYDMDGNVSINAPETITLNAKNISMNAEENIFGHAGQNIDMNADMNLGFIAGEDYQMSANNFQRPGSENSMHTAKKYEVTAKKARIDSTNENLELASS